MNKVILIGRLTKDPNVTYSQSNGESRAIARYTLAVDRGYSKNNSNGEQQTVDFISCVAFGKTGEFVEKYLHKGTKIVMSGRIENNNYTDTNGNKVYRDQIIAEEIEFAESKKVADGNPEASMNPAEAPNDGFMKIPNGIENDLPFR